MKKFEPKMSGGELSPEAHAEWKDKGGKHVSGPPYSANAKPSLEGKGEGIGLAGKGQSGKKGASLDQHEEAQKKKSVQGVNKAPFPGKHVTGGFPTGPMEKAGAHMGKIPADGGTTSDTPMVKPKPDLNDRLGGFGGMGRSKMRKG